MSNLTGSEKQIIWAETIKSNVLKYLHIHKKHLEELANSTNDFWDKRNLQNHNEVINDIENINDSKIFIDHLKIFSEFYTLEQAKEGIRVPGDPIGYWMLPLCEGEDYQTALRTVARGCSSLAMSARGIAKLRGN